jgi:uncharacterized protein YjiS (DUF1127 family)
MNRTESLHSTPAPRLRAEITAPLAAVGETLRTWWRRSRQRRELRALLEQDGRILRDVGLTRRAVREQARKWFWQA